MPTLVQKSGIALKLPFDLGYLLQNACSRTHVLLYWHKRFLFMPHLEQKVHKKKPLVRWLSKPVKHKKLQHRIVSNKRRLVWRDFAFLGEIILEYSLTNNKPFMKGAVIFGEKKPTCDAISLTRSI